MDDGRFNVPLERGTLRSGARLAARNVAYHTSVKALLKCHRRLLQPKCFTTAEHKFANELDSGGGPLVMTVARFHVSNKNIRDELNEWFFEFYREHSQRSSDGYEVVVTFNAILKDEVSPMKLLLPPLPPPQLLLLSPVASIAMLCYAMLCYASPKFASLPFFRTANPTTSTTARISGETTTQVPLPTYDTETRYWSRICPT
jgi:hypothetical protein